MYTPHLPCLSSIFNFKSYTSNCTERKMRGLQGCLSIYMHCLTISRAIRAFVGETAAWYGWTMSGGKQFYVAYELMESTRTTVDVHTRTRWCIRSVSVEQEHIICPRQERARPRRLCLRVTDYLSGHAGHKPGRLIESPDIGVGGAEH